MNRMERMEAKRRRAKQVFYQKLALITLSLIIVLLCAFFASCKMASGKSNASLSVQSEKYYTSIEIQAGDSLWSIAKEHMSAEYGSIQEYVTEVIALNQLSDETLHAGEYLLIPYYSN